MSERAKAMTNAIEVSGLTKVYRTARGSPPVRAVDGIDFTELSAFDNLVLVGLTTVLFILAIRVPAQRLD